MRAMPCATGITVSGRFSPFTTSAMAAMSLWPCKAMSLRAKSGAVQASISHRCWQNSRASGAWRASTRSKLR
jgi:hypothetical protein